MPTKGSIGEIKKPPNREGFPDALQHLTLIHGCGEIRPISNFARRHKGHGYLTVSANTRLKRR